MPEFDQHVEDLRTTMKQGPRHGVSFPTPLFHDDLQQEGLQVLGPGQQPLTHVCSICQSHKLRASSGGAYVAFPRPNPKLAKPEPSQKEPRKLNDMD